MVGEDGGPITATDRTVVNLPAASSVAVPPGRRADQLAVRSSVDPGAGGGRDVADVRETVVWNKSPPLSPHR